MINYQILFDSRIHNAANFCGCRAVWNFFEVARLAEDMGAAEDFATALSEMGTSYDGLVKLYAEALLTYSAEKVENPDIAAMNFISGEYGQDFEDFIVDIAEKRGVSIDWNRV